ENASEIYESLRYSLHVKLFGASSVEDHGRFRYDNYIGNMPNISSPDFDSRFISLLNENKIDVVFATHDTVVEYLATLNRKLPAYVVNSDANTAALLRSKRSTYRYFANHDWCPQVFDDPDLVSQWPIIAKPDRGQGAQGVELVYTIDRAHYLISTEPTTVLVEYLPGEELTIDCFTDRNRRLVW